MRVEENGTTDFLMSHFSANGMISQLRSQFRVNPLPYLEILDFLIDIKHFLPGRILFRIFEVESAFIFVTYDTIFV